MKKKIVILTSTRAEYGLLKPIINALNECEKLKVMVVVTGAHLSPEFGLTYKEIEADGIKIDRKIDILLSSDTSVSVSKAMGLAIISFSEYFEDEKPDALLVLGDRYETLAVCCAAMNARIPIFHLHGGETTEGAIDEAIRHSITKMSYLHFTATESYRKRVIQLGEAPERVFCVGSTGVENALTMPLLAKKELEDSLGFDLNQPYAVVTFHPVTLEEGTAKQQCKELIKVFKSRSDLKFLITKANADAGGHEINHMLEEYVLNHSSQAAMVDSLGVQRYLSAVKYSEFVLGNSSSGIIEVPSLRVPTINIGDRQTGRIQAESIINCQPIYDDIMKAIKMAETEEFQAKLLQMKNPYEGKHTSADIAKTISEYLLNKTIQLNKRFYDL